LFYRKEFGNSPLLVVTNREPIVYEDAGRWTLPPGGVSQTIHQLLGRVGGQWIALKDSEGPDFLHIPAPGPDLPVGEARGPGYRLDRLSVPKELREAHYAGFSNGVLWPFFHNESSRVGESEICFSAYGQVNRRFAGEIIRSLHDLPAGAIWVHDYQLAFVAREVRRMVGSDIPPLSFFWHIPWVEIPNPETVTWLGEFVSGLLSYDQIGFQTALYRDHFIETVQSLFGTRGNWDGNTLSVDLPSGPRTVLLGVFPISIDPVRFQRLSMETDGKARALDFLRRQSLGPDVTEGDYLISVDRMDYTKGFLERLDIMESLFVAYPQWQGRISLLQIAPPTRQTVGEYRRYADQVRARVASINAKWGSGSWIPVRTVERALDQSLLAPLYRMSEGALITATHDGMNLVAKEFLASQEGGAGVLFLSCHTGAAQTMEGLSLIDPFDPFLSARVIHRELMRDRDVRQSRNRRAVETIHRKNVYRWMAENFFSLRNRPVLACR
jgi:trehalose 6-phosphate synthase